MRITDGGFYEDYLCHFIDIIMVKAMEGEQAERLGDLQATSHNALEGIQPQKLDLLALTTTG